MRQGREYWSRHVEAWRQSELSKKAYSEQHELAFAPPGKSKLFFACCLP